MNLYSVKLSGGTPRCFTTSNVHHQPHSVSKDGKYLIYNEAPVPETGFNIWAIRLDVEEPPCPFLTIPVVEASNESIPVSRNPIDHSEEPVESISGGNQTALERLKALISGKLQNYSTHRNQPEGNYASGLSPFLHVGHFSPHTVFRALAIQEGWSLEKLSLAARGK